MNPASDSNYGSEQENLFVAVASDQVSPANFNFKMKSCIDPSSSSLVKLGGFAGGSRDVWIESIWRRPVDHVLQFDAGGKMGIL